jgi:hypothetical protein
MRMRPAKLSVLWAGVSNQTCKAQFYGCRHLAAAAAATLLAFQAAPAHADRDPWSGAPLPPDKSLPIPSPITDHFYIRATFFDPSLATTLRIDQKALGANLPNLPGTVVNGEKDLGLGSRQQQGRIEIMFRLRERNRLRVDYFETNRRADDHLLTRQIQFGAQTFDAGDLTTSSLDWRSFGLTYTYSLIRTDRFEVGTGIAVNFLEADAQGAVPARNLSQEVSGSGAFPTIPLDLTWRISRRFAVVARGQYFRASVSSFEGSLAEYHGDVQYRWKPNFTLGAGYTDIRSFLSVNDANFPGLFRLNVRGPEAFFKVSF